MTYNTSIICCDGHVMFQIEPEINTVLVNKCVKVIKLRENLVLSILKRCHLSFFGKNTAF